MTAPAPCSRRWLVLIALTPVVALLITLYVLSQPVDPWAAGALWGAVLLFFTLPGILLPLLVGVLLGIRMRHRGQAIAPGLYRALLPGLLIALGGLGWFAYSAANRQSAESHMWQLKIHQLPQAQQHAIESYLSVIDTVVTWADTSPSPRNQQLTRWAANAEACLQRELPTLSATERETYLAWALDAPAKNDRARKTAHWKALLKNFPDDYQSYRAGCDPNLNFNLDSSVGRIRVCDFSGGWQDARRTQAAPLQPGQHWATPPAARKIVQSDT